MKTRIYSSLLAFALASTMGAANAVTAAPASLTVQILITDSCSLSANRDIDFGSVIGGGAPSVGGASGELRVTCTIGTPYLLKIGMGLNSSSATQRNLERNSSLIRYSLSATQGGAEFEYQGEGNGAAQLIPVWGAVTSSTNVTPGQYTDVVAATIEY